MTDDDPDVGLRLAALELLLCALDPTQPTDSFNEAVMRLLEPVVADDGKVYVGLDRLRYVLEGSVAEIRALMPEQPPGVQQAIDEVFDQISERVDELTEPKPRH